MKTQVRLVSLFIVLQVAVVSSAQVSSSPANSFNPSYSPRIYEVGTTEFPSDAYNPFGISRPVSLAETTEQHQQTGIRGLGGYGSGDDPGEADPGSPVGDPLALAFFALLFTGMVAVRTRLKKTILKRDHHGIIS